VKIRALSVERKWRRCSKVSRARRFAPSRVTYHGNVSRSNKSASSAQFIPLLSLSLCPYACAHMPLPPFARRCFFLFLSLFLSRPVRAFVSLFLRTTDRSESMSRMHPDAYDTRGSVSERNGHERKRERDVPRRDGRLTVRRRKNVIVSLVRACDEG